MRIKKDKESNYREKLSFFLKDKWDKKNRFFYRIFKVLIILLVGIFIGFLFAGFFGTIDTPSPKMVKFVNNVLGGQGHGFQEFAKGILAENIRIPFNYIAGQFSKPEKLYIDIAFKDWQKIAYKREIALENKYLLASEDDWVQATISDGNKKVKADVRLKGDLPDHWITDKWSLRFKVNGDDTLYGMKSFSIQTPRTRTWLNEFIYQNALKKEDVLNLRYKFVDVYINGKHKGIYALEEHFAKQLIEYNNRREGPIIRFDETMIGLNQIHLQNVPGIINPDADLYPIVSIDSFQTGTSLLNPEIYAQFENAKNLLELVRLGKIKTSEAFDVEKTAKYFALNTVLGADHASQWNNIRFYYNPITSRLEPIGFDANSGVANQHIIDEYFLNYIDENREEIEQFPRILFTDSVFFKAYIKELERMSQKEYLDELFKDLDKELKKEINILHKDYPYYHFSEKVFYDNQKFIQSVLNPVKSVNAYVNKIENGKATILVGNIVKMPLVIEGLLVNETIVAETYELLQPFDGNFVDYKKIEFNLRENIDASRLGLLRINYRILGSNKINGNEVLPWDYLNESVIVDTVRKKAELSSEILDVNENEKIITIKQGNWVLDNTLVIPKGYKVSGENSVIDLVNKAMIVSYSDLQFNNVKVISSDKTGEGLLVYGSKINFENVEFRDLNAPVKDSFQLTGAITFYESEVNFENVLIKGMKNGDDSVNFVRSKINIKNSRIEDGSMDCVDGDFVTGIIDDFVVVNCGGDGLDFSGSSIEVRNFKAENMGDKGMSIGENSSVLAFNVIVDKAFIGVASKDLSKLVIDGLKINNVKYGFAVYMKKTEYGTASLIAKNAVIDAENSYIVEKDSSLEVNGKIILDNKKKVYEKLYPGVK